MYELHLLRHAKSNWDDVALNDHDRPLAPRGVIAATAMGRFLNAHSLHPDLVLCSDARRTRNTLALVDAEFGQRLDRVITDQLYLCGAYRMLTTIRSLASAATPAPRVLLVIAHNPDLQELALHLAGDHEDPALTRLQVKLPTAGLVSFAIDGGDWANLSAACAQFKSFVTPADLKANPDLSAG